MSDSEEEDLHPATELERQLADTLAQVEGLMANVQSLMEGPSANRSQQLVVHSEAPVQDESTLLPGPTDSDASQKMTEEKNALEIKLRRMRRRVAALEAELEGARNRDVKREEEISALQQRIQSMLELKEQRNSSVSEFEQRLAAADAELSSLRHAHAQLQRQAQTHQVRCADEARRIEELENRNQVLLAEREYAVARLETLSRQCQAQTDKLQQQVAGLENDKRGLQLRCQELEGERERLLDESRVEGERHGEELAVTHAHLEEIQARLRELERQHAATLVRYREEISERRTLFNTLQELRGNIRVLCRVRPLLPCDPQDAAFIPRFDTQQERAIYLCEQKRGPEKTYVKEHKFEFDKVLSDAASQDEVFVEVRPLVTSVMDGFNVCIFAYGQTGSGKTYTMEGAKGDGGINRRTLEALFELRAQRHGVWEYSIKVSVVEIYNESAYDLLGLENREVRWQALDVRQSRQKQVLLNAHLVEVHSTEEVIKVLDKGQRNRAVGQTDLNLHSSRSHCLLTVYVEGTNTVAGEKVFGKLHLVDLAGSEKTSKSNVSGEHQVEANHINKSLSALGDVIHALSKKEKHIPYRNSHLTFVLSDSLGGDSKVLMIANVNPSSYSIQESLSSLNFASAARRVELGRVKKNLQRLPMSPG